MFACSIAVAISVCFDLHRDSILNGEGAKHQHITSRSGKSKFFKEGWAGICKYFFVFLLCERCQAQRIGVSFLGRMERVTVRVCKKNKATRPGNKSGCGFLVFFACHIFQNIEAENSIEAPRRDVHLEHISGDDGGCNGRARLGKSMMGEFQSLDIRTIGFLTFLYQVSFRTADIQYARMRYAIEVGANPSRHRTHPQEHILFIRVIAPR